MAASFGAHFHNFIKNMPTNSSFSLADQWRLNDARAEFVRDQPREDYIEDMRDAGEDIQQMAAQMDALFLQARKKVKQEILTDSRRQYEEYLSKFRALTVAVPQTLKEKKEQLIDLLMPSGLATATVQFRELSELTETDLEAYYRSCQYLNSVTSA